MHKIETKAKELVAGFLVDDDFNTLETSLVELSNNFVAEILQEVLEKKLACKQYLKRLKELGGQFGLRFKAYVKALLQPFSFEFTFYYFPY